MNPKKLKDYMYHAAQDKHNHDKDSLKYKNREIGGQKAWQRLNGQDPLRHIKTANANKRWDDHEKNLHGPKKPIPNMDGDFDDNRFRRVQSFPYKENTTMKIKDVLSENIVYIVRASFDHRKVPKMKLNKYKSKFVLSSSLNQETKKYDLIFRARSVDEKEEIIKMLTSDGIDDIIA